MGQMQEHDVAARALDQRSDRGPAALADDQMALPAYSSEVEREFARKLDEREDIKLFVKLPNWFQVDTPVAKYNPDWAIVKHDGQALYLVRETKGTRGFLKLRTSERTRCGAGSGTSKRSASPLQ
jgi:restriction endonuclease